MKNSKGIGAKLYILIVFIMIFVLSICSFSWISFKNFDVASKNRLETTASYITLVDDAREAQVEFKKQVQEWKNILLRGNDSESYKKYYDKFTESHNIVQSELKDLKENMSKQGIETASVDSLLSVHSELYKKYNEAIKSYDQKDKKSYEIVDKLVNGIDRQPTDDMDALVKQIQDIAETKSTNMKKQAAIDTHNFNRNLIIIATIGILLIIFFSIMIIYTYKGITKFIDQFKTLMSEAEKGDLTIQGKIYKKDELGELTERFNNFVSIIRSLISESKDATLTVASSSNEIMKTSAQISNIAEEVASTISNIAESASKQTELAEQSNESVIDVVKGLNNITENSEYINKLADKAISSVTQGTISLNQQINIMSSTKDASNNVSDVISRLSTKSDEIGNVVEFIHEITGQINLLSLNASIEAARAGEAGKGFTVVANEVKKLADLSRESTQKISSLIAEVQTDIQKAVIEVSNTNNSIDEQANSLKLTDDSLKVIQESVLEVTNKIKEVAIKTEIIDKKAVYVEKSINNIVNLIEENASNTQEAAASTEEHSASIEEISASINNLAKLSNNLQETIAKFKV